MDYCIAGSYSVYKDLSYGGGAAFNLVFFLSRRFVRSLFAVAMTDSAMMV